jgi:formate/nitrite transporter FocA (FNT family)
MSSPTYNKYNYFIHKVWIWGIFCNLIGSLLAGYYVTLYLNFKLSNQEAYFVAREHEINRDITPLRHQFFQVCLSPVKLIHLF